MSNELAGKYSGTVLICGSAPCLFDDYNEALRHRPNAEVIAINDAASVIYADFLATLHPEDAEKFRAKSMTDNIIVISGQLRLVPSEVDYWFTDCNSGGTTAGSAIKMARVMGFEEIILCGCPMSGGDGYFDAKPKPNKFGMSSRFGNAPSDCRVVKTHQQRLCQEAHEGDYQNVSSMSGFTREFFGPPKFIKERAT